MNDQTTPQQNEENPGNGSPSLEGTKSANSDTASPATAEQLTEVEKQMSGFEKSTLTWARTAVVMSGLAAIFVFAQWHTMESQLSEMRSQRELTDRAWIEITDVKPIDRLGPAIEYWEPNQPPYFPQEAIGLLLEVDYKNAGHSPATNIEIFPELYLIPTVAGKSQDGAIAAEEKRFWDIGPKSQDADWWRKPILFPDNPAHVDYVLPGLKADITKENAIGSGSERAIFPIVVVCISYHYQSSSETHLTSAVFEISDKRLVGDLKSLNSRVISILHPGERMKADDLWLRRYEPTDEAD
jgi:hypothetical protein